MSNNLVRVLKRILPRPVKQALNSAYIKSSYYYALLIPQTELRPPNGLSVALVGGGDYREVGRHFLSHFIKPGGLQPTDRVLDVGCGLGRMAVPLTTYLTSGSYEGFDIVPLGIKWCQKKITPRFPNFRFQLADVYNQLYHPKGTCPPDRYRFPYPDRSFDFVFLTSVFTHMLPADLENYLAEIARVLQPGKRCFITFFILTDEATKLMTGPNCSLNFQYKRAGYSIVSEEAPEAAIGFPEAYVREIFAKNGLTIQEPLHWGSWPGRENGLTYQDVVVAVKN